MSIFSTEYNPVIPNVEQITRVLRRSERIWYSAKVVADNQLTALDFSNWAITGCWQCGLGRTLKDTACCPRILGIRKATSPKTQTHKDWPRKRTITAIAQAVSYIFSKRLVELQGQGDGISLRPGHLYYTNNVAAVSQAETPQSATSCTSIFVGEVEDDGWKAEIAADSEGSFLAPWVVQLEDKFTCRHKFSPPSSIRAMELLRDFCVFHDAQSEIPIAMSIALMLPANNIYGLPVNLQWQLIDNSRFQSSENNIDRLQSLWDNLAHYLSICCHPRGMTSNLCGGFWEPGIPCNMAYAWLYPPCRQLPDIPGFSGSAHLYHEALLRVYVARRLNMGFLYLGAYLTGIIPLVGCEQSFIQNAGPQVPASPNFILRTDIWWLLYITGEYPSPLLTPWGPFGEIELQNVSLAVRLHEKCADHYLSYRLWSWKLADDSTLEDKDLHISNSPACSKTYTGEQQTRFSSEALSIPDSASENATRLIFQWVTVNGGGFSPSERDIYSHEWVNAGDDFSEFFTPDESKLGDDTYPMPSSRQLTADWLMRL
ncbi:uncharacterized protein BDW47DRAFT_134295 [Aspergillus candidus]|uniref:Uncharacterized protein n=1 Tax=Aspergillus candidus TaxID=41067 RepID=A0A2I2F1N7_ASPCN|nr:hypothetical protein BDW47DRAFT_134295 [Aspergillus candidus]PLB34545.1 hypothetical protein BDW47DRAFT_134295 [Aspergillus candidus]